MKDDGSAPTQETIMTQRPFSHSPFLATDPDVLVVGAGPVGLASPSNWACGAFHARSSTRSRPSGTGGPGP